MWGGFVPSQVGALSGKKWGGRVHPVHPVATPLPISLSLGKVKLTDIVVITPIWNSLPNWVVDVDNINTFKARLDRFWSNQEVLYYFTADINGTGDRSQCDIDYFCSCF